MGIDITWLRVEGEESIPNVDISTDTDIGLANGYHTCMHDE